MDRSAQGVVPRTCLSKHPIKPVRAASPAGNRPRGPSMRGPQFPGTGRNSPGPYGPGAPRALSPSSGRNSPRPLTPTGGPMGPGPQRMRANTNNVAPPFAQGQRSASPGPYPGSGRFAASDRQRSNSMGNSAPPAKDGAQPTKIPVRNPVPSGSSAGSAASNGSQ